MGQSRDYESIAQLGLCKIPKSLPEAFYQQPRCNQLVQAILEKNFEVAAVK